MKTITQMSSITQEEKIRRLKSEELEEEENAPPMPSVIAYHPQTIWKEMFPGCISLNEFKTTENYSDRPMWKLFKEKIVALTEIQKKRRDEWMINYPLKAKKLRAIKTERRQRTIEQNHSASNLQIIKIKRLLKRMKKSMMDGVFDDKFVMNGDEMIEVDTNIRFILT